VLFWPALFFLEGGDGAEAQEYARLKGEFDALQQMSVQKRCNLPQEPEVLEAFGDPGAVEAATAYTQAVEDQSRSPYQASDATSVMATPVLTHATLNDASKQEASTAPPEGAAASRPRTVQRNRVGSQSRVMSLAMSLQEQIVPCWTVPPEAASIQGQGVRINLNISSDGSLKSVKAVDQARMLSDPVYRALAESAERAVALCSPLNLPQEDYEVWNNIVINFRRAGTGGA
jgi:hypothetical protein